MVATVTMVHVTMHKINKLHSGSAAHAQNL